MTDTTTENLSHNLVIKKLPQIEKNPERYVTAFEEAIAAEEHDRWLGRWRVAEMLYYVKKLKLWQWMSYVDENGSQQAYNSFSEYVDFAPYIPFKAGWGYVLERCYRHYRLELGISNDTPALLDAMNAVGSFEKLRDLEKIVKTPKVALEWFHLAANMQQRDLEVKVDEAVLLQQVEPGKPAILPSNRRVRFYSDHLRRDEIGSQQLWRILPELEELPENAVIEITARVVSWDVEEEA